jgi:predicted nucleic acid-binding Zn ribbon protein
MLLAAKDIRCQCGHVTTLTTRKLMCIKCGKYVFYNDTERRRHRNSMLYLTAMLALGLGVFIYLFIEMVAVNILPR